MNVDNPYNLDLNSVKTQPMSNKRANEEVLRETFKNYFGELNYFFATEQANLTYADVVAHIGVDPSEYRYDDERKAQIYSWYAAEAKPVLCMSGLRTANSMLAVYIIWVFRKCLNICERGLLRQPSFQ